MQKSAELTGLRFVLLVGVGLALASQGLGVLLGFEMAIPWDFYQLLDRQQLTAHPWTSLLLLHAQPPLLNGGLALILALTGLTGVAPEFWAWGLFAAVAMAGVVALGGLAWALTRSRAWAIGAMALVLADPAGLFFQHLFFYPALLATGLTVCAWSAYQYLATGRGRALAGLVAGLVLTSNTSSLYHPLWACLVLGATVALRCRCGGMRGPERRMAALAAVGLLAGVLAWPAKNAWLFGQFTTSTWTGYNAARATTLLRDTVDAARVNNEAELQVQAFARRHPGWPMAVLAAPVKADGAANWNRYLLVVLNRDLPGRVLQWRMAHPGAWLRTAVAHYAMWTRAPYADCYFDRDEGPPVPAYRAWQHAVSGVLYADLRPVIAPAIPWLGRATHSYVTGNAVQLTLFGWGVLPVLLALSLGLHLRRVVRDGAADSAAILTTLLTVLWVLVVPCLTDGHEGNRMRHAVTPLLAILAIDLAARWRRRSLGASEPSGRFA